MLIFQHLPTSPSLACRVSVLTNLKKYEALGATAAWLTADNAHVCITGHITAEELKKRLSEIEMANGFGNRFLWFYVKSDKVLPNAKQPPKLLLNKYAKKFKAIIEHAQK